MSATEQISRPRRASSDVELAGALATAAGVMLVDLRTTGGLPDAALRAEGDRRAHRLLLDGLLSARPGDSVLSEEGDDDPARLDADRVWILDPLDGTREYAEGRSDWAVHVALWERGVLTAGAVALPAEGVTATTDQAHGQAEGRRPAEGTAGRVPRLAVSRTRPPAVVASLTEATPLELVPMGSAGYKIMAVVRGEVDAYVHAGGQYEWDSAAPVAVALAAGLRATRLDGSPLRYNRRDPFLPDLVVVRPGFDRVLRAALDTVLETQTPKEDG